MNPQEQQNKEKTPYRGNTAGAGASQKSDQSRSPTGSQAQNRKDGENIRTDEKNPDGSCGTSKGSCGTK